MLPLTISQPLRTATGRLLIAQRLARFPYLFMARYIFNKRQADSYFNSTWNLLIILVYLNLNFLASTQILTAIIKELFHYASGRAQADSQKA